MRNAADAAPAGGKHVRVEAQRPRRRRRSRSPTMARASPKELVAPDLRSVLHDQAEGHRPRPRDVATRSSPSTAAASTSRPSVGKGTKMVVTLPPGRRRGSLGRVQCPICTQALEGGELVMVCTHVPQDARRRPVRQRDRRVPGADAEASSAAPTPARRAPARDQRVLVVRQARGRGARSCSAAAAPRCATSACRSRATSWRPSSAPTGVS